MQWFLANWQAIAIAVLAIDAALIPLFPHAGFLVAIKNFLGGFTPPPKT